MPFKSSQWKWFVSEMDPENDACNGKMVQILINQSAGFVQKRSNDQSINHFAAHFVFLTPSIGLVDHLSRRAIVLIAMFSSHVY